MKKISLKADAEAAIADYKRMEGYSIQEELLLILKDKYPDHKNVHGVDNKVKLLNLFYSTGIQATNTMTEHIMEIKDIDSRLVAGDLSLVAEIAKLTLKDNVTRYNYSFATKYCAYHQPEKFPIYDSIVAKTFVSLFAKGYLPKYKLGKKTIEDQQTYTKGDFDKKLKDYKFFVALYNYFMENYDLKHLSYREVDAYIWGAFKVAGPEYEIEKMAQLDKSKIQEYTIDRTQ